MIRYSLICSNNHDFEAWFKDSASCDEQGARGQIACPHCGDTDVRKAIMAPGLISSGAADTGAAEERAHEVARKILAAVGGLREKIEDECDYVGDNFADEARRIHYGDAEERGIFGEATDSEVEELDEEGIEIFRVPDTPPRRDN